MKRDLFREIELSIRQGRAEGQILRMWVMLGKKRLQKSARKKYRYRENIKNDPRSKLLSAEERM